MTVTPAVSAYSTTPANNVQANTGVIWDEGMAPAQVNNSARQNMADTRSAFNDLIWFKYGKGDMDYSPVYVSSTSFKIAGADVSTVYHVGRRVRAVGSSTGTIYGTISAVAFSTDTTVTVLWDSGSLSNETLTISISQIPITGHPIGATTGTGSVVLATAPTISGHPTIEGVTSTGATGTGNLVYSANPTLTGTLTAATISASNNISNSAGNISCNNGSIISGNTVSGTGFNVTNTLSWQGNALTSSGAANYSIVARTNGVQLNDGGTSWGAISTLDSKADLAPIPGAVLKTAQANIDAHPLDAKLADCPFKIINAHRAVIGRYKNRPEHERRPFLIYEDAAEHFPHATAYTPERKVMDWERDADGNIILSHGKDEAGALKFQTDAAGKLVLDAEQKPIPILERTPKEHTLPESKVIFYDHYIPLLMATLQKQHSINQDLAARLTALETAS